MQFPERMTIQSHTITIVPWYAETDKGGVIHHSVYYKLTRRSTGLLLAEGSSVLACATAEGKIRRIPDFMYSRQGGLSEKEG